VACERVKPTYSHTVEQRSRTLPPVGRTESSPKEPVTNFIFLHFGAPYRGLFYNTGWTFPPRQVSQYCYCNWSHNLSCTMKCTNPLAVPTISSDDTRQDRKDQLHSNTGCHRRNGPNFGRVFLMLNYTDITQNTYAPS